MARERQGRTRRKERGVGKEGTGMCPQFYPFSLKPTICLAFHGRSDRHLGGLSALENVLQPVLQSRKISGASLFAVRKQSSADPKTNVAAESAQQFV